MSDLNGVDPLGEDGASGFDLKEVLLYGIGRSRYLVGFLALLGLSIGLLYAASIPNNYTATASLRYTPGLRERHFAPEVSLGVDVQGVAPSVMAELMLLDDPAVFKRAAEDVGVAEILIPDDPTQYDSDRTGLITRSLHRLQKKMLEMRALPEGFEDSPLALDAAAGVLRERTTFTPLRQSTVITVTHTSSSKDRAVRSLGFILDACVERHREQYRTHERLEFSRAREADLFSQLQTARLEFREYRSECGVENIEKSLEQTLERLGELDDQISDVETSIASTDSELTFLRELIGGIDKEVAVVIPAVKVGNPRFDALLVQKEQVSIELVMLAQNTSLSFSDKERQKSALETRLREYDRRLLDLEPFVVQQPEESTTSVNQDWVDLQLEIRKLEGTHRAASARLAALEADQDEALEELEHVRNCEESYSQLSEVIDDYDRQYQSVSAQNEELENLMRLDEAGAANLSRYTEPRRPASKDGPQRGKLALMGLFGGLAVGLAIAVARQLLETRIRYPRSIEREFGFPVLATVPELRNLRRLRGEVKAS